MHHHHHNPYTAYYLNQAGTGYSNYYSGAAYQRGFGIGSYLGGIFRSALPLLKSSARYLGDELLRTGSHFLSDIADRRPAREALKTRFGDMTDRVSSKIAQRLQSGSGAVTKKGRRGKKRTATKRKHNSKRTHSSKRRRRQRSSSAPQFIKSVSTARDIFD